MNAPDSDSTHAALRHEDPLTHEAGAHPLATGVGAAGGGATGAAIGLAVGGPVGGVIGAVIGAVAGGLGGSAVGESIEPTIENESWPGQAESLRRAKSETAPEPATSLESALHRHGATLEPVVPAGSPEHGEIALRAWSIYESEGYPEGQDLRHWLAAEATLARV